MLIGGYETHPAADLFPMLSDSDLSDLAEDIKANGLSNPITLINDDGEQKVLDGRNRLRACELAEVTPRFVTWTGTGSPISWVVSQNLHRRHLTESQRAEVAVGLVPLFEAEAKEREREGGRKKGTANLREADKGTAAAKAAAAVGVSERLVQSALKVQREGTPELVAAVRRGEVTVSAAVRQISKPKPRKEAPKPLARPPDFSAQIEACNRSITLIVLSCSDVEQLEGLRVVLRDQLDRVVQCINRGRKENTHT